MMKVLLGTLAVLTLAACSKDEVVQQNPNDAITFSVVTNKAVSRAADGYCNAVLPPNFKVWAKQGTKNYFAGEKYVRDGSTTHYVIEGPTRYWPESGTIDFFAALNYEGASASTVTWDATSATEPAVISNFVVPNAVANQKDFIYAVLTGADKTSKDNGLATTKLNFRHGLCEVVFKAQNLNKNIYVEVTGVKVQNVQNKGTFKFPIASTNDKTNVDVDNPQDTEFQGEQGTWTTVPASLDSYNVTFDAVPVSQVATSAAAASLTYDFDGTEPGARYSKNALYLMEQQSTALWDGSTALMSGSPLEYKKDCGAYLILTCSIWNVADGDGKELDAAAKAKEVLLWDNKDIAVKLPALAWKHGRKYVYTFKFTADGNGGTNPEDMTPVFTPIVLDVTVDDFVAETDTPVSMVK